jgi:hypothetical protein
MTAPFTATTSPEESRDWFVRAWIGRLYSEYDRILFQYRLRLATPVIRIQPLISVWANWNPAGRAITLAERLIDDHPWDIVIDILKHEMAHQLVDEGPGGRAPQEGPHGARFQEACRRLGVPSWAAAATGTLPLEIPNWRDNALAPEEQRLLERVDKLLALAQSTNEHEAALAVERVRELYAKYNLERIRSGATSTHVHCVINQKRRRIPAEESVIFSILNAHFMVRAVFNGLYDARDLCEYKVVELMGTRENVLMAEYVYYFLLKQLEILWREYRLRTSQPATMRRSYMLGALEGFRKKLTASAEAEAGGDIAASQSTRALLRRADQQLDKFVAMRFPRLSTRSLGGGRHYRDSFNDGVTDGASITLHRGVDGKSGNRGAQLPERSR